MKKLFLVDVSSMYFRAFYAIRGLTNSKGMPTNALYGFTSMSAKFLKETKPDYMVYCFDRKEPSFRVEIDPRYKANRDEMPEDLQIQVPYISKITDALGIPRMDLKGFEADDIIGTLAKQGREHGLEVVIISGDKDFSQLVGPMVTIYDPMKEKHFDVEGVRERLGVPPERVLDYLALVGDSSDNIPGVRGIGPKGALKLLTTYRDLDDIYANIEKIKPEGVRKKLLENKDEAYLSKKLVTIIQDVPVNMSEEDMKLRPVVREDLTALLHELDFKALEKTLLGTLNGNGVSTSKDDPRNTEQIGESKGEAPIDPPARENGEVFSADVEGGENRITSEQRIELPELERRLSKNPELWALFGPRGLSFGQGGEVLTLNEDVEKIKEFFKDREVHWKGYDLKEFFKFIQPRRAHASWDQMLAAYVVRAGNIGGLEEIYEKYCGLKLPELPTVEDTYRAHLKLEQTLRARLETMNCLKVLYELELPLVPILYRMEKRGILLDQGVLEIQSLQLGKDLQRLEKEIHELAGEVFNIASPKQLAHILFTKLQLTTGRKTKTGFSTDSDVLEKLATEHAIPEKVLEYRELAKLRSTYVDALPQLVDPKDGRLHTHFNQAVTTTGRLSSTNPNLQNIPIRTERGNAIREAFVAPKGSLLLSADYSQIELRILAHVTDDPNLIKAFREDRDIHAATAAEVFGVPLDEVNADLRRMAKAVNFGIAYGMGVFGLAENLKIPRKEAGEIIERYFVRFPRVKEYTVGIVETAKKQGYVETLFGRRRYLDELYSKNKNTQQFGERAAINAPMQGTASDIMKKAMIDLVGKTDSDLLLQVHDELVYEAKESEAPAQLAIVKDYMQSVTTLKVPLKVDTGVGPNWASIK